CAPRAHSPSIDPPAHRFEHTATARPGPRRLSQTAHRGPVRPAAARPARAGVHVPPPFVRGRVDPLVGRSGPGKSRLANGATVAVAARAARERPTASPGGGRASSRNAIPGEVDAG